MVAVFIEVDIHKLTNLQRGWSFCPIFSCNWSRNYSRIRPGSFIGDCNPDIFLRGIRVFILKEHVKLIILWKYGRVDGTEIRIKEHFSRTERNKIRGFGAVHPLSLIYTSDAA